MSRSFIKDFLILSSGTFINILISVFTTPIITRIVEPAAYGQYSLALTYGTICSTIAILGLDQALMRFFYESEDGLYRRSLIKFCFTTAISVGLVVCLAAGGFIFLFVDIPAEGKSLFALVFGFYVLSLIVNNFSSLVNRMQFKTKMLSLTTVLNKIFFFGFAMLFIFTAFLSDSLSLIFATGLAFLTVSLVRIVSDRAMWKGLFQKGEGVPKRSVVRYALPICLSSCIAVVLQGIDKIGLNFFATDTEIGIYASAFALVNIFSIVQSSFNTLWAPTSMEKYEKNPDDVGFFVKGCDAITLVMFGMGLLLIIFKDVFILLLGPAYREAAALVPYLIFFPMFYTVSETTVSAINLKKRTQYHIWISAGSLAVAAVSVFTLVPLLGIKGAALSLALAYATFFALRSFFARKCMAIPYHFGKLALTALIVFAYATYCTFFPASVAMSLVGLAPLALIALIHKGSIGTVVGVVRRKLLKKG